MKARALQPAESEQRGLFRAEQLPELPALVSAAKECAHTGKIVGKDQERAESILKHYLQTGSLRATAKHLACSPNTIMAVLNEFERCGKLDALKQRLSHKLGLVLELGADDLVERLTNKKFKPSPIDLAVLIDKKLLLDGEATQRIEETRTVRVDVSDVLGYLRTKGIAAPAIEVESTVSTAEPKQTTP